MCIQSNLSTTATLGTPKKWPLYRVGRSLQVFSIKIGIKSSLAGLRLAVVDRWPLFRGGRYHRFDCIYYLHSFKVD